ncbi:hypothetical protein J4405_04350 [Candidatus Woesearchaeota archaeon]|nr:hypothetical protein [Candidatus Woesearchaeota archaeon]
MLGILNNKIFQRITYSLFILAVVSIVLIFIFKIDYLKESSLTTNAGLQANSGSIGAVDYQLDISPFNRLIQNTPAFQDLPDDSIIVFSFYDGNGNLINGLDLTLKDKTLSPGLDTNYDFRIITGVYYLEKINQVEDMCAFLNEIKNNQDARIERKISVVKASLKYKNMLKYKDCLGL